MLAMTLYIGTISHADDYGRIEWSALQLMAKVFPTREDVKIRDVEAAMGDLVDSGLLVRYEADGRKLAYHPAWTKHQYVSRPTASKFPEPPRDPSGISAQNPRENAVKIPQSSRNKARISTCPARAGHFPSVSDTVSDTVSETTSHSAGAREAVDLTDLDAEPEPDRRGIPPESTQISGVAFAKWFTERGIEAGAIPGQHFLAPLEYGRVSGGIEVARLPAMPVRAGNLRRVWVTSELGNALRQARHRMPRRHRAERVPLRPQRRPDAAK